MSDARWERLQELFHEALACAADERGALLDRRCGDDRALRDEVAMLLSASDRAGRFIEGPAMSSAGALLEEWDSDQVGRRVGAFRLVRAIGRGGMGTVYLAERDDGAFRQRVAIKRIKRGMDTDLVLARFRAERQILASLDHPNIARLIDGGATDDGLPFFAMEFIEGEPIDAYAASHALGLHERLRLFLAVCEAVAYAHAHGVIHRDLKPLNTLVTPSGVPKLLDFGIAKVVGDAPDDATETVTGMRLLTPDYASPEQVEGRRATAASDVYSLGVMLYELLTGRSPYPTAGCTPVEVARAVRTVEPEAPSTVITRDTTASKVRHAPPTTGSPHSGALDSRQLSRRLRGDLDAIVLTALRKEPARRYASVEALAADIRRHLEGRPIAARTGQTAYRLSRLLRRRRGLLIGATTALALVVAAAIAWRGTLADQAGPTLLSSRALSLRDRVVVSEVVDQGGDTLLAAAITEAIRTDLSQSSVVRVLTPRQVRAALSLMQAGPDVALNDSLARELAAREGVKAIVTGSLVRLPGSWTIGVQLVAARDGEALATVRESVADSTQLVAAVERASRTLRERIGESLRELRGTPSLVQATTASLPALKEYSEAQRLVRQGKRTEAVTRFEAAIALDTAFASAYLGMSMAYGSLGDMGRSFDAGTRALAHKERLTFLERSMLTGSLAYAGNDYVTAIRAYDEVVARYPDHIPALNNLALAHRDARQFAVAESVFRRAVAIDTVTANLLFGLHTTQVLQGKFAEASATLALLARRFPGHPVLPTEELQDAAARQDWTRAVAVAQAQATRMADDTLQLVDPIEALAQIAMVRGQLGEADRLWRVHAGLSRAAGLAGRHLFGVIQRGHLLLRLRHDTARAVAFVDSATRANPLEQMLAGDRRYDELARFYLAAGRVDRAAPLVAAADANDRVLRRTVPGERLWTRGLVALAQGRVNAAADTLRRAAALNTCPSCVLPDYARALERAARPRDAATTYAAYLTTPWLWRYEPDAIELAGVLQRLASLYVAIGEPARAQEVRNRLRSLWRDADPALREAVMR